MESGLQVHVHSRFAFVALILVSSKGCPALNLESVCALSTCIAVAVMPRQSPAELCILQWPQVSPQYYASSALPIQETLPCHHPTH